MLCCDELWHESAQSNLRHVSKQTRRPMFMRLHRFCPSDVEASDDSFVPLFGRGTRKRRQAKSALRDHCGVLRQVPPPGESNPGADNTTGPREAD